MKQGNFTLSLSIILLLIIGKVFAQEEKEIHEWYDSQLHYGQIELYNGVKNITEYKIIDKNHKFYKSPNYVKGDLVYENQLYFDVEMKYDLYDDQLIIKLKKDNNFISLKLIAEKTQSFEVYGRKFTNLTNEGISYGFVEVLYRNSDITIFKKYKKNRKEYSDKKILYSKFHIANEYFILSKDKGLQVVSKNSLKELFPEKVKNINLFYKKRKSLRKTNFDSFLTQLIKHLNSPI